MSKIAIVYWSGTGNTEAMAIFVAEGAREAGADAEVFTPSDFDSTMLAAYDAVAFGCSSQGAEELEDSEFAPMFDACEPLLSGKTIGLFGSYGWGDGEWMRSWYERCAAAGAVMPADFVICCEYPDDDAQEACKGLGRALV